MTSDHVERARALKGSPFRPQGRCPATGLDCVGLVFLVYGIPDVFRRDYRIRGDHLHEIRRGLEGSFCRIAPSRTRAGDLLLWRLSADQLHLGISTGETFIHADAKLGRILETPGPAPWHLEGAYRRRIRALRKV